MSVCDVSVASCKDSLVMTEPSGWMELDQAPIFTEDGRQFAMVIFHCMLMNLATLTFTII